MEKILLSILLLFATLNIHAQSPIEGDDLTNFRAESLKNEQIVQIKEELQSRALSIEEFRRICISKGMSMEEFNHLESRLNIVTEDQVSTQESESNEDNVAIPDPIHSAKKETENTGWIFGSEIFSNSSLSFEPNQTLSNPTSYVLGSGDEIQVVIYGVQQFTQKAHVNSAGNIILNNIGSVHVGGLTIGAATDLLKKRSGEIYNTLNSGRSELSITLTQFKSIQVTLIGVKQPGNYSLSSLSTVFNALHIAGGPSDNGTYRNIELIRNNKLYKTLDLYDFLTQGDLSSNIALQNDDILRVPTYSSRITISGSVKRPGIYELKEGENFEDLIRYCSGFSDNAYRKSIQLFTTTDSERKILTIGKDALNSLELKSGDAITVGSLLETFENKVELEGAVYRPAAYELKAGMTVYDLVSGADGLTPDAFKERALLIRKGENLIPEVIGINIGEIMNNPGISDNMILEKDDKLVVSSLLNLKEERTVEIQGEVIDPGVFPYIEDMSLYDLIIMAGGLKESASSKVEIARVLAHGEEDSLGLDAELIDALIDPSLKSLENDIPLENFDFIFIRKIEDYGLMQEVIVKGEVKFPGIYIIAKENETVGDILARAGGPNTKANRNGIKIVRNSNVKSTLIEDEEPVTIPIDYQKILDQPESSLNIHLQKGDVIVVEALAQTTKVLGAVALSTEIPIRNHKRSKYYINAAGGFNENADKNKTYVIYSNGQAKTMKRFLFFKIYPKPKYGSSIIVPENVDSDDKMSTQEVLVLTGVLSSISGVTIAVISLFK